jgi:sarcosine oxidase
MDNYDLIVVGLGAVGSAALCQAALRGARVLGMDRFHPPHEFGSSHGETRITRQAIGEGAECIPLVLRSNVLWRELEASTGEILMVQNGGLILLDAPTGQAEGPGGDFFARTVAGARQYSIPHEMLTADGIRARFPQFRIQDGAQGYFEPGAGFLYPERCIAAQLKVAAGRGARLHTGEIVTAIHADSAGVEVVSDRGRYRAGGAVLSPGAWMSGWAQQICSLPPDRFAVYRQTLYWFALEKPEPWFFPESMPIFLWNSALVEKGFYGFPTLDGVSIKVATEQFVSTSSPDGGLGEASATEMQAFYEQFVTAGFIGLSNRCLRATTCFYTVVPDHKFLIDHAVESNRIWFASACSGHGFKHSAAIGEALAQKALGELPAIDLRPFAQSRRSLGFAPSEQTGSAAAPPGLKPEIFRD